MSAEEMRRGEVFIDPEGSLMGISRGILSPPGLPQDIPASLIQGQSSIEWVQLVKTFTLEV